MSKNGKVSTKKKTVIRIDKDDVRTPRRSGVHPTKKEDPKTAYRRKQKHPNRDESNS